MCCKQVLMCTYFFADYAIVEKPSLETWMQEGYDYIVLRRFDIDCIRTIGIVLGQSIALDHFVRQVSFFFMLVLPLYKTCPCKWWSMCRCQKLLDIDSFSGRWYGGRIYWFEQRNGEDRHIYNESQKTFSACWTDKYQSCKCNFQAWAFWKVIFSVINLSFYINNYAEEIYEMASFQYLKSLLLIQSELMSLLAVKDQ